MYYMGGWVVKKGANTVTEYSRWHNRVSTKVRNDMLPRDGIIDSKMEKMKLNKV